MNFKSKFLISGLVLSSVLSAYIVKEGDTLWDLSDTYLDDPFSWTEIWRVNPQIEDPHWIYPGDEVTLPGDKKKPAEIEQQEPIQQVAKATGNDFHSKLGDLKDPFNKNKFKNLSESREMLNKKDSLKQISFDYILQAPRLLPPATDLRIFPEEFLFVRDESVHSGNILQEKQEWVIESGSKDGLQKGDVLELFLRRGEDVHTSASRNGDIMVAHQTVGFASVINVADDEAKILIELLYDHSKPTDVRLRRLEKRKNIEVDTYEKVVQIDYEAMSRVIHRYKNVQYTSQYEYLAVEKNKYMKANVGDVVAIWEGGLKPGKDLPPDLLGTGIVVLSDENSFTVLIKTQLRAEKRISTEDFVSITYKSI